jgi:CelD/BcsL family acetyltransferase involved in cellulose biosynthesis
MVDGTATLHLKDARAVSQNAEIEGTAPGITFRVETADTLALETYEKFLSRAIAGVAQQPIWIRSWIEATAADAVILTMLDSGRPVLILALETTDWGPFRIARFIGGSHANANFPAIDAKYRSNDGSLRKGLVKALSQARPDIDALYLERQTEVLDGAPNPLFALPSLESPNIGLEVSLEDGLDGVLAKHNAKRRLKKHRYQKRKFEEAGGYRVIAARSPEEIRRLLDSFMAMKEAWFREHGVRDVFTDEATRRFFETLFLRAAEEEDPPFFLDGLEVDGELRAITGSSKAYGRVVCQFGSIASDELTQLSPGEFLTYGNIQAACDWGCSVYDYGVGDEPYKRMWCDQEIRYFDTMLGISAKGRIFAASQSGLTFLKRQVKSRRSIFELVKRLRRLRSSISSQR